MFAVTMEREKLAVLTRLFTIELKLDLEFTSTSLEISRFGRVKLWTAEEERMVKNSSESICRDPGNDEGS